MMTASVCAQEVAPGAPDTTLFREGLAAFSAEHHAAALALFNRLIREYPESDRITATLIMRGKALVALGEYLEAARAMKSFLGAYPQSRYLADAHDVLARAYETVGRREEAVQELTAAWHTMPQPPVPSLTRSIIAHFDSLVDRSMGIADLKRLLSSEEDRSLRAYLWVKIGEQETARENSNGLARAVDTLTVRYPDHPFKERARALGAKIERVSHLKVAAVLPLMKENEPSAAKEIARDVADGILCALEAYQRNTSSRISLAVDMYDTKRDPKIAANIVRTVAGDPLCVAVIGPVFSVTATSAAVAAQTSGIPLISPTANANGIAAAGPYVFQANPDYENRGRAMARYAVLVRGLERLATLAPSDSYGKMLAEAFAREAQRLGAKILSQEWYTRGVSDLQAQFAGIRKAGMSEEAQPLMAFSGKFTQSDRMRLMDLGVPRKRIDSLLNKAAVIPAAQLLGPRAKVLMDSVGLAMSYDLSRLDSLQYPVKGIQAVYAPIASSAEIGVISPQFVYFNLQAQLLGSGEWNDLAELHEHRRYCTGLVFESDTHVDTAKAEYREFLAEFRQRFNRDPSRNVLYGYDTGELLFALIRNGATTRTAIARTLAMMKDFQGLHAKIGFSPSRANMWLSILRFGGEGVELVEEIRVD
jgi:ABC-type branched-subunit amino acid transport system substrate-binding protein